MTSVQPALLLDASSDIDFLQAEEIGADLLMQTVEFRGERLLGAGDITAAELFDTIDAGAAYPVVSAMSVAAYIRLLERMLGRASHVLVLHPKEFMSANIGVAQQAAAQFPGKVTVLEAGTISSGMALQARWLLGRMRAGMYPTQAAQLHAEKRLQQRTVLWMPNIQRFKMVSPSAWNRRLSPKASLVVGQVGDNANLLAAAHSDKITFRVIQQYLQRYANAMPGASITFFHCGAPERAAELGQMAERMGLFPRWTVPTGLSLSAHIGAGAFGYSILPE